MIYQKAVEKSDLDQYRKDFHVISTKLLEGRLSLRIQSETAPGNGFIAVPAELEDVYFSFISQKVDPITI
jgi:hypothetical protein